VEKLVRDREADLMRAQGDDPVTRVADEDDYRVLLNHALTAAACAVIKARGKQAASDALADLSEVVRAIADLHGIKPGQLEQIRADKKAERGGFGKRTVWTGNR
jgi:predicted house-cleaning noncanonical NTP pyrophosphatase (MazG superfamily)